jgi:hypothetical protein
MADSNDSRPGPCEQALISKAASRAVEFLEFLSGSEGLAVVKSGRRVTITYTPPEDPGGGDPGEIGIEDVDGLGDALAGKAATSHTHATSEVTGLDSALAGKAATSHTHATSEVTGLDSALAGKAATSHTHATSEVTGLDSALAGKAATSHTHATSEVTGLDSALAGKAASSHTHATSEVTGLDSALAGKAASSHTHATSEVTGLDSALAGKAASSHTHATSEVTGLDSALAGKAATSHTHATSEVTGLDSALAGKAASSHTHATSEVTGLDSALAGKAASSHTHATSEVTGLDSALSGKAASSHSHATSDVTGLDSALSGKAATSHNHNASDINAGTLDAARLPVAGTTTIGGVKRNAGVAGQYVSGFDTDGSALYGEPASLVYRPGMNMLINGDFAISQRGSSFTSTGGANNDGNYTADRWFILSDGNDIVDIESSNFRLKLDTETANKKFGIAQIIENRDAEKALGLAVTFSFYAYWAIGQVEHVKAAILEWTGTADAPTHDFISAWNGDDTLPTLAANWAFLNSPVDLNITSSSAISSVSATVGTSVKNLAVLIWSDSTASTVGNWLFVNDAQLEIGASFTSFQQVLFADQLARCQRYYEVARYNEDNIGALSSFYNGTTYNHHWYYKAAKRIKPVVTLATGSWTGGAPTINEGIDSTCLTRVGAFFASGTSGNVCLAADAEL